jgi:alkylated DNA repair dioxygenase AlkB
MASHGPVPRQRSLFGDTRPPDFDRSYASVQRVQLDAACWVDHASGWVTGSDALFAAIEASRQWGQRTRVLWDKEMLEPRLTSHWRLDSGQPLLPPILEQMRVSLGARYGVEFDSAGFNLYRDGRDSVAWHGDKIRRDIAEPIVVLVSLGEPRRFLLRPYGGGRSLRFDLGGGDLLVTGGRTQRDWQHSVPKVSSAGPRISIAFRHGLDPRAYGERSRG